MNKPALKRFASEARRELLERVELQARKIGITSEGVQKATIESSDAIFIDGKQLTEKERVQRNKLISRIRDIGFDRVMEEVAYTWFNRFTALRFMEVNDYLPTKVRVLSSHNKDSAEPDMMKEALSLDLDLDKEFIYNLKMANNNEELFKYLLIKHCNDLNKYMPFMFETIDDYTEVLFPAGLLSADSFIRKMTNVEVIPESNWEKIEVIGWLYQYYIAEEKDRVFKAKKKYKAEEIPFATQLFTPDWIVRYMVQNSLGRYWVEANPEQQDLISNWEFYLQNSEEGFAEKIAPYINKQLKIEDIKCFDPAMGSGHILVYMFDVLYEIYSRSGYTEREIPRLIIENNLFGLDIDDRAYQLACFSVVMKALEYNIRFLRSIEREGLTLNLASIEETNILTKEDIDFFSDDSSENLEKAQLFIKQFQDAKSIGSLIKVIDDDTSYLQHRLESIQTTPVTNIFEIEQREKALFLLPKLVKQVQIMSLKFDVLVTNPPYMGSGSMNKELGDYLKKHYPDSKADLFSAFMEVDHYLKPNGFYASINQHSWMFLSSFEELREKVIDNKFIESMLHLGPRAFEEISGEVVQSTTFVLRNSIILNKKGIYVRLVDEKTAAGKREKAKDAIQNPVNHNRKLFDQKNFKNIPGAPIAYWLSERFITVFEHGEEFGKFGVTKKGILTGNDARYVKTWFEVDKSKIGFNTLNYKDMIQSKKKWFPITGGGFYRKWYGNLENVVNLENDAYEIRFENKNNFRLRENTFYFQEGMSWTEVSSKAFSLRFIPQGVLFGNGGPVAFVKNNIYFYLGLLNSKVNSKVLSILAPTINYGPEQIKRIPVIYKDQNIIEELASKCVMISKEEWDNFEISWDFKQHPFIKISKDDNKLENSFENWKRNSEENFQELKSYEEKLNLFVIEAYNLQNELNSNVHEEDVTIRKADLTRDIKSFISYAIGCSFGRYSLDEEGLIYAGGEFNSSRYRKYPVDKDNIIPIVSNAYFKDDITTKFIDFIRVTYGEEMLENNLNFVAKALGRKKYETAKEVLRRYFLNDFYKDHIQVYKKRPVYWLITSGKEKAFNCLIYMHRYDKTTLSRIRTDYLHEVQIRMDTEKKDFLNIINGDSTTKEITNAKKELKSLDKKIDELKAYDEKLHHMADMQIEIDLDDGVVVNYAKFEGLVAKI